MEKREPGTRQERGGLEEEADRVRLAYVFAGDGACMNEQIIEQFQLSAVERSERRRSRSVRPILRFLPRLVHCSLLVWS